MAARKPTALELGILLGFHATFAGGFLVAYLTGDEDTYGMHLFSGYAVAAALAVRLLAALFAPVGSPLRLPKPNLAGLRTVAARLAAGDIAVLRERSPLHALMAVLLLFGVGTAVVSGIGADFASSLDHVHEALGQFALWIVFVHLGLVATVYWLKRRQPARVLART